MLLGLHSSSSLSPLKILGVTISKCITPGSLLTVGTIRRLQISKHRRPVLYNVAKVIVIGKAQTCASVTRTVRLLTESGLTPQPHHCDGRAQITHNDLTRVLLGVRRSYRMRTTDLLDRAESQQ
ncbi:Hypothetical protein FKW44_009588 [Caligus rogercresseyi]|uniref:Uncharacterized protein n=1 Tax=Caligus rogercresseyi TaxID=217165 RepID=A0A7T8HFG7_CALRO|nr:Hypothetical protein FKW44_009588 [Caligus rogercresseyi]